MNSNSVGVRISCVKAIFKECYGFAHCQLIQEQPFKAIKSSFITGIDLVFFHPQLTTVEVRISGHPHHCMMVSLKSFISLSKNNLMYLNFSESSDFCSVKMVTRCIPYSPI